MRENRRETEIERVKYIPYSQFLELNMISASAGKMSLDDEGVKKFKNNKKHLPIMQRAYIDKGWVRCTLMFDPDKNNVVLDIQSENFAALPSV